MTLLNSPLFDVVLVLLAGALLKIGRRSLTAAPGMSLKARLMAAVRGAPAAPQVSLMESLGRDLLEHERREKVRQPTTTARVAYDDDDRLNAAQVIMQQIRQASDWIQVLVTAF